MHANIVLNVCCSILLTGGMAEENGHQNYYSSYKEANNAACSTLQNIDNQDIQISPSKTGKWWDYPSMHPMVCRLAKATEYVSSVA